MNHLNFSKIPKLDMCKDIYVVQQFKNFKGNYLHLVSFPSYVCKHIYDTFKSFKLTWILFLRYVWFSLKPYLLILGLNEALVETQTFFGANTLKHSLCPYLYNLFSFYMLSVKLWKFMIEGDLSQHQYCALFNKLNWDIICSDIKKLP